MELPNYHLLQFYERFWGNACRVIVDMESAGCYFDVARCLNALQLATEDIATLRVKWETFAPGVNPASPKQLPEFLYTTKKFPVPPVEGTLRAVKRTLRGKRPVTEASIDWLHNKAQQPENKALLACLLQLKKVTRLAQFLTKLPSFVDSDGRLFASFGPDTNTGRLSSRCPNLQNIPGAAGDKYGIRGCFIAPPGHRLLVADYAALEPRILAHWLITLFDDHSLAEALAAGDLYGAVACNTWPDKLKGIAPHEIKENKNPEIKKLRDYAKIIVLSSNYGKSVGGLALQLNVPVKDAEQLLGDYFRAYPGIQAFHKHAHAQLGSSGIRTILGRTRIIPPGKREYEISKATRVATNTIIQGSAADVVMAAMVKQCGRGGVLQMQIHDELVWRVPEGFDTAPLIDAMEHPFKQDLKVPLSVDAKLVSNWAEAK